MYVNNSVYKNFEKKEKNLKDAKRSFLDELKLKEEKPDRLMHPWMK